MEVQFSAEQEAQLSQVALHHGTTPIQLVKEAALRLLAEEEQFRAAVREGIAAADQGLFVEHERLWLNVEEILAGS